MLFPVLIQYILTFSFLKSSSVKWSSSLPPWRRLRLLLNILRRTVALIVLHQSGLTWLPNGWSMGYVYFIYLGTMIHWTSASCSVITFGTSHVPFSSPRRAYTSTVGGFPQVSYPWLRTRFLNLSLVLLLHCYLDFWLPCSWSEILTTFLHWIELEMRRPDKERYRLDKLLERKAKEGVKIYVIL